MSVLLAGVAALLLLAAPMEEALAESAPQVTRVSLDRYWGVGCCKLDQVARLRVEFDQPVDVTGKPQLTVEIGSQQRKRNLDPYFFMNSDRQSSASLTFEYYSQASDLGYVVATGIDLNGGAIRSTKTREAANLVFERTRMYLGEGGERYDVDRGWLLDGLQWASACGLRPYNVRRAGTRTESGKIFKLRWGASWP